VLESLRLTLLLRTRARDRRAAPSAFRVHSGRRRGQSGPALSSVIEEMELTFNFEFSIRVLYLRFARRTS